MNISTSIAASVLLAAAAAPLSADEEDFNWTEAAQFVDSFPFKQKFIDSIAAARQVTAPSPALRSLPPQSFSKGELLAYDIGWSFVKGGYIILTATPDAPRRTIRLGAKALSRGLVSTFYRMRDYVISTVDAEGLYPLFFEEHLREGKHYKSNKWMLYDHAGKSLHLKDRTVSVPEFTNDYISVLYMARTKQFAPGDTFILPFFVDGKLHRLLFSCARRATADFNGKDVRCLVTQPQPMDDKGDFNKQKRLEIWFSDDEYKLPIRIKAKIAIGSIIANLIYAGRPKIDNPAAAAAAAAVKTPARETAKKTDSVKTHDAAKTAGRLSIKTSDTIAAAGTPPEVKNAAAAAAADTAEAPAPPVSRSFYETIEIHDAQEVLKTSAGASAGAPALENECGDAPEQQRCSRDNSY
jgi:hypothetical protein